MELDLTNDEFQIALTLIQETNQSFFLTGRAGTGKSTFLKHIVKEKVKNCVVVAPTGIAAVNVEGVTIHSFFQLPHSRPLLPGDDDIPIFHRKSEKRNIIAKMDTLIIDEISMVRVDILDAIDYSLRRNGGKPNLPFGGKQVVFVGDIFQLEPVVQRGSIDEEVIRDIWRSPYFYRAKAFGQKQLLKVELRKVYRQSDPQFIDLLNSVREGNITRLDNDKINCRIISEADLKREKNIITLTTKNDIADIENAKRLAELTTQLYPPYQAEISGDFPESKYPTASEILLKAGAQVIFIKNDLSKRWVNGTIGQVLELTENSITVKLEDGNIYDVEKHIWENCKYFYNKKDKKIEQEVIGTFKQYPLKLAWAITIHKSQGMTLQNVIIDTGTGTFASGQLYVALSRVTSFEGLFLKSKVKASDIYVDEEVKEFAKSYNDQDAINEAINFERNVSELKQKNDYEVLGELYFEKAITNLILGNFELAFNELMSGFDHVTCECYLLHAINKNKEAIGEHLSLPFYDCTESEMNFIEAVFYFFTQDFTQAQIHINSFLQVQPNSEITHYLKGRIEGKLRNFKEAITELEKALAIGETARTIYRYARIKEEALNEFAVDNFFKAVLLNPSSLCAHRWLQRYAHKRKIKLKTNTQNLIAKHFNTSKNIDYYGNLIALSNKSEFLCDNLSDFLMGLKADEVLFNPYSYYKNRSVLRGNKKGHDKEATDVLLELIPYRQGKKWGFCNKNKQLLIPCIYENIERFTEGLAAVLPIEFDGRQYPGWGYIDAAGNNVIDFQFTDAAPFYCGIANVHQDYYTVSAGYYIDQTGDAVNRSEYSSNIYECSEIMHEEAELEDCPEYGMPHTYHVDRWYLVDRNGMRKMMCDKRKFAGVIIGGLAVVKDGRNFRLFDVARLEYIPGAYEDVRSFQGDVIEVKVKGKWGYVDKCGKEVIHTNDKQESFADKLTGSVYDDEMGFSDGLAGIKMDGKWGFINHAGEVVIDLIYGYAESFSSGLAYVGLNEYDGRIDKDKGGYGYIDKQGTQYWEE